MARRAMLLLLVLGACSVEPEQAEKAERIAHQGIHEANRGFDHTARKARDKWEQAKRDYGPVAKREWERLEEVATEVWMEAEAQAEAEAKAAGQPPLPPQWWTKAPEVVECEPEPKDGCRIEIWFVQACQRNPLQIRKGLELTPVYDPEHPEQGNTGVEVRNIARGSVIDELGFVDGDEVQRVNGLRVADPMNQFKLYSQLRDRRHFEVVFARDGETLTKTVDVVDKL